VIITLSKRGLDRAVREYLNGFLKNGLPAKPEVLVYFKNHEGVFTSDVFKVEIHCPDVEGAEDEDNQNHAGG
jgi:hypothetical protein